MRRSRLLMATLGSVTLLAGALAALGLSSGCASLGYYGQAIAGHLELIQRAEPVQRVEQDAKTPADLRERLALAQRMRDFAVAELKLPDNASYRRYVDLGRAAVVWNVVAAPELSLTLKTWCYALMGCAGYRGYFNRDSADAMAAELQAQSFEVSVYGVPAYSTLGWSNWIGGDPLLSTFIRRPEGELARLMFHELAHQVAYAADDTAFNESFATAVERIGGARWLSRHASEGTRAETARLEARRQDFRALTAKTRQALAELYASAASDADKRARKAELMARMRAEYTELKATRWDGFAGYDAWFQRANNAALGVQAAYDELVPDFERLFEREGSDFERFYAAVKALADLPKPERYAKLRQN